jgi:hypothetical protein
VLHTTQAPGGRKSVYFGGAPNYLSLASGSAGIAASVFTMCAFIRNKPPATAYYMAIMQAGPNTGGREWRINATTPTQTLLKANTAGVGSSTTTTTPYSWKLVICTYNSSTGAYKFYLDGTLDGSGTNVQTFTAGTALYIGNATDFNELYRGEIADLWYYDHVLSDSDRGSLVTMIQDYYGVDKAPHNMTTDSLPAPYVASAISEYLGAYLAFKSFDGDLANTHNWLANGNTGWLIIDLGAARYINSYGIYAGYTGAMNAARSPKDWTLQGSNTGAFAGEQITLDTRTGETSWSNTDVEYRGYTITGNLTAYRYYKIDVTLANGDASLMGIIEMYLYSVPIPPIDTGLFSFLF